MNFLVRADFAHRGGGGGSDTRRTLCNDCSGFLVCQNLHKPKGGILMSEVSKILRTFVVSWREMCSWHAEIFVNNKNVRDNYVVPSFAGRGPGFCGG